uniref:Uncharacterized protein n=1 Tax=Hyaloperonospora arabidopsidis (strain Emoy2) TaxID=559515 RepID=M4BJ35_HYAAE
METKMPTGPPSPTPSSALMTPRESPQGEQATPSLRGSISDSPSTANDRHEGKRRLDKARRRASRGRLLTRDPNKKPRAASAQRTASRRRKRQERAEGLKCAYDSDPPPPSSPNFIDAQRVLHPRSPPTPRTVAACSKARVEAPRVIVYSTLSVNPVCEASASHTEEIHVDAFTRPSKPARLMPTHPNHVPWNTRGETNGSMTLTFPERRISC